MLIVIVRLTFTHSSAFELGHSTQWRILNYFVRSVKNLWNIY